MEEEERERKKKAKPTTDKNPNGKSSQQRERKGLKLEGKKTSDQSHQTQLTYRMEQVNHGYSIQDQECNSTLCLLSKVLTSNYHITNG